MAPDPARQGHPDGHRGQPPGFVGNIWCTNCHSTLNQAWSAPRVGVSHFQYRSRNATKNHRDRINDRLQRSLVEALLDHLPRTSSLHGVALWTIRSEGRPGGRPLRATRSDTVAGREVFAVCAWCHGPRGSSGQSPVWGDRSHHRGRMARLRTAAASSTGTCRSISPARSEQQAYDVAAYVTANPARFPGKELDWLLGPSPTGGTGPRDGTTEVASGLPSSVARALIGKTHRLCEVQ